MPIVRITGLPVPPSDYDLSPVPGPWRTKSTLINHNTNTLNTLVNTQKVTRSQRDPLGSSPSSVLLETITGLLEASGLAEDQSY